MALLFRKMMPLLYIIIFTFITLLNWGFLANLMIDEPSFDSINNACVKEKNIHM